MYHTQTTIHIGANKTASTLLQKKLFSKHKNICYFGEYCENYDDIKDLIHNMIHEDAYYYDQDEIISKFSSLIKVENTNTVFSHEDIMGSSNPTLAASRLKNIFPKAKVLMIIRNQFDVFPSWYINHGAYLKNVPKKLWKKFVGVNEWLDYCFSFPKSSPVQAMNYLKYYKIFSKIFGKENVIVIPYEEIFEDRQSFCVKLSSLFDVLPADIQMVLEMKRERPRNTKLHYQIHKTFSFSNKLSQKINSLMYYLDISGPAKVKLDKRWIKMIYNEYAEKNYLLASHTGLDLKIYNYPLKKID